MGASFHFIVGGDIRRLALFLLSAWVGFALGHVLGGLFGIDLFNIGPLHIVSAVMGALVALVVANVISAEPPAGSRKRQR
jgi:uncharacterized membrane protein YeaQ/YmgE (transglycosylase-associated protein family)